MDHDHSKKDGKTAQEHLEETFSEMATITTKSGVVGKLLVVSLIVVSIAVTAFVGFAIFRGVNGENRVDNSTYQAVFLNDGQTYYGKLSNFDGDYMTLTDVYYLKVDSDVQSQKASSKKPSTNEITLVKLGEEKHCPSDTMYINRDQISFWENIRPEGQVAQAIDKFLETRSGNDEVVCSVPTPSAPVKASNN
jgi:hypothetical protein